MKRSLYVQLGRAGDILNMLPLCKRDFDRTGRAPLLMVSKEFLSLLEGVSYVEPLPWAGRFEELIPACALASDIAAREDCNLIVTQIYGENMVAAPRCASFDRESWDRAPHAPAWGRLPLVIDRRDEAREDAVVAQAKRGQCPSGVPYVVIATDGISSPFAHSSALKMHLRERLKPHGIGLVDISSFRAPRMFDLLKLIQGAHCFVTIDTGVLHLAHAAPDTPVVRLVCREPSRWHAPAWRPHHVARFFYDECPDCFDALAASVIGARYKVETPMLLHVFSHIFNGRSDDVETARRNAFARRTWIDEYATTPQWLALPFDERHVRRDSFASPINDDHRVPFMRDMIGHSLSFSIRDDDIIVITNSDVSFCPGLTGWILDVVPRCGAAYTHRWDFFYPLTEPLRNEAAVSRGKWYPGSDAFFFTVKWWREHGAEYPDMLIGREQNDEILRQLIKRHCGIEIPAAIYHEKHDSFWEHFGNREKNAGNIHNRRLARKWFLKTGYGPGDPEWWRIPAA